MICKVCGRTITNEEANFCEYCGASFRPGMDNRISDEILRDVSGTRQEGNLYAPGYTQAGSQQEANSQYGINIQHEPNNQRGLNAQYRPSAQGMKASRNASKGFIGSLFDVSDRPMTLGNWLIIYLLPIIPVVGKVLFLIVLFSWGFGSKVAPTKKNWARATMIYVLIMIIMLTALISSGYLGDPNAILKSLYGTGSL